MTHEKTYVLFLYCMYECHISNFTIHVHPDIIICLASEYDKDVKITFLKRKNKKNDRDKHDKIKHKTKNS